MLILTGGWLVQAAVAEQVLEGAKASVLQKCAEENARIKKEAAEQAAAAAAAAAQQARVAEQAAAGVAEQAAAEAAAKLLQEEAELAQAAQRSKQKAAAKKARQKQRKQVLPSLLLPFPAHHALLPALIVHMAAACPCPARCLHALTQPAPYQASVRSFKAWLQQAGQPQPSLHSWACAAVAAESG